jgi:hypothetical protein
MKSKLTGISTILILILWVATPASAGCPDSSGQGGNDYSSAYCDELSADNPQSDRNVCTDCDDGSQQVCCYGEDEPDRIILAEDPYGNPVAYGVLNIGDPSEVLFCCTGAPAQMGTSSAVFVYVDTGDDDDKVCLHDSTADACEDNWAGLQYWDAGSDITTGAGADTVATCPSGSYVDDVDTGSGTDLVHTYDGADTIWAGGDEDDVDAGDGADTIWGEEGSDYSLAGGSGVDTIHCGDGDDVARAGSGNDTVNGNDDNDSLYGGVDDDDLFGDLGADYLGGDGDDDCLCGGSSGPGNNADLSTDTYQGNAGTDICYYLSSESESVASSACTGYDTATCGC